MIRHIAIALAIAVASSCALPASDAEALSGPYLGQSPPGSSPRLFAPGVISVRENFEHSAAVFSPDGTELFWCTNVNWYTDLPGERLLRLYTMKVTDGAWTPPAIATFTERFSVPVERPVFSPDGSLLYFEASRNPNAESDTEIYCVERIGSGWSEPSSVSPLINSQAYERIHCVTADGSIIFARGLMTSREAVFISHLVDGEFSEPERLAEPFDTDLSELAIVMPPDESYMLINLTRTGREDLLYVSYREPNGDWTERIRAPFSCGGFLALSPDAEYLFFLGNGISWVSTSFVENLKPAHLR